MTTNSTLKNQYFSYEVIAQEDADNILIPIPPQLAQELNWKEGDQLHVSTDSEGKFIFHKNRV